MSINKRLEQLIDDLRMNNHSFSVKIGVAPTVTHNIVGGRNKPSFEYLEKVFNAYPRISKDWLISGEGEMYLNQVNEDTEFFVNPSQGFVLRKQVQILTDQIDAQNKTILELNKLVSRLNKIEHENG